MFPLNDGHHNDYERVHQTFDGLFLLTLQEKNQAENEETDSEGTAPDQAEDLTAR